MMMATFLTQTLNKISSLCFTKSKMDEINEENVKVVHKYNILYKKINEQETTISGYFETQYGLEEKIILEQVNHHVEKVYDVRKNSQYRLQIVNTKNKVYHYNFNDEQGETIIGQIVQKIINLPTAYTYLADVTQPMTVHNLTIAYQTTSVTWLGFVNITGIDFSTGIKLTEQGIQCMKDQLQGYNVLIQLEQKILYKRKCMSNEI